MKGLLKIVTGGLLSGFAIAVLPAAAHAEPPEGDPPGKSGRKRRG